MSDLEGSFFVSSPRGTVSSTTVRRRGDVLFAVPQLAENGDLVRNDLEDEELDLVRHVLLEGAFDDMPSSNRSELCSNPSPDHVEVSIPLVR